MTALQKSDAQTGHALTQAQVKYLTRLMRNHALKPHGREFSSLRALAPKGLVSDVADNGGVRITVAGLQALRDYRMRRWGNSGCMAYLLDLQEVEAALATGAPA